MWNLSEEVLYEDGRSFYDELQRSARNEHRLRRYDLSEIWVSSLMICCIDTHSEFEHWNSF